METFQNLKRLFVAILFIIAGLVSPSNGLDDRTYKTPLESLAIVAGTILFGGIVYGLWSLLENKTQPTESVK